jgi:hypothetical protein
MIVTDVAMGCGGRDSVGAQCEGRAGRETCEPQAPRKTNDADADGKTVWSWHPLLVSSWRRCCEPDHPAFPAPSVFSGRNFMQNSGKSRRGIADRYLPGPRPGLRVRVYSPLENEDSH